MFPCFRCVALAALLLGGDLCPGRGVPGGGAGPLLHRRAPGLLRDHEAVVGLPHSRGQPTPQAGHPTQQAHQSRMVEDIQVTGGRASY